MARAPVAMGRAGATEPVPPPRCRLGKARRRPYTRPLHMAPWTRPPGRRRGSLNGRSGPERLPRLLRVFLTCANVLSFRDEPRVRGPDGRVWFGCEHCSRRVRFPSPITLRISTVTRSGVRMGADPPWTRPSEAPRSAPAQRSRTAHPHMVAGFGRPDGQASRTSRTHSASRTRTRLRTHFRFRTHSRFQRHAKFRTCTWFQNSPPRRSVLRTSTSGRSTPRTETLSRTGPPTRTGPPPETSVSPWTRPSPRTDTTPRTVTPPGTVTPT